MRFAVDASGGGPLRPVVEAAVRAVVDDGHEAVLFGPREALLAEVESNGTDASRGLSIVDAPGVLDPGGDPSAACRENPDASAMAAARAVAEGRAEVFLCAGDPAAAAAAALWHMKRVKGVLKPALVLRLRTRRGTRILLDAGATVDCKPWHILQFALMGSLYASEVLGKKAPSVGLISPGPEGASAGELVREALPLLRYAGVGFQGTLRASEIPDGGMDVFLTDGSTGEALSGLLKGLSRTYSEMLESELDSDLFSRLGGRLARAALARAGKNRCSTEPGGAALIGVGGSVVVVPPGSEAGEVRAAFEAGAALHGSGLNGRLAERLEDIKSNMEFNKAIK